MLCFKLTLFTGKHGRNWCKLHNTHYTQLTFAVCISFKQIFPAASSEKIPLNTCSTRQGHLLDLTTQKHAQTCLMKRKDEASSRKQTSYDFDFSPVVRKGVLWYETFLGNVQMGSGRLVSDTRIKTVVSKSTIWTQYKFQTLTTREIRFWYVFGGQKTTFYALAKMPAFLAHSTWRKSSN